MYPLVYIVRHGQTAWNAEFRLQGQADTDLNALGREQATGNGRRLAKLVQNPEEFDFVASPMKRTRETMQRVRVAMKLDPGAYRTDPRLVEVNFGDWQGFTFPELETRYPGASRIRALDKWNFQPPGEGAESYQMLLERVRPCFDAIQRRTICVTHGGVMRALFRFVLGLAEDEAANLEIPHDRLLKLEGKSLEWL
ncbi:histidine phosphatase family protein [Mesorhizobium sp. M0293]|uniref:histidine phosphatase family protein n=1 Tax=unclassified Mesorhizobium TaxID=325217 RepID=UPI00333604B1